MADKTRYSANLVSDNNLYVDAANDRVGIGTTIPTSKLTVSGDAYFTGVVTATSFSGTSSNATYATTAGIATYASSSGIATYATTAGVATALQNSRTFEITGDILASPIGFDGTGNVSFAATIQPNSVGLGTDTTGDYVQSITGTTNQITVTGGSGEGSTPVISIPSNPTLPGNVTIANDLQVNNNLNVSGNITIGGTSAYIIANDFRVKDADIVLGFTTDTNGNDVSNDTTANHGGIAIASTEGSPLIEIYNPGIGETNPATYKKIMWFKSGAFTGLNTDAWLINYGVGIGSTQFPSGTRLAVGSVQITQDDLAVVRSINASGISTFTNGPILIGSGTSTGTASQILQVTGGAYVSGNLGIGSTNPSQSLYVLSSAGKGTFENTSNGYSVTIDPSSAGPRIYMGSFGSSSFMEIAAYGGINNFDSKFRDLKLFTSSSPAAFIIKNATGNVGIGTTNPTQSLDVNGTARIRSGLYDGNNNVGTAGSVLSSTGSGIQWIAAAGGSLSLINTQTFSSPGIGTWTKPSGAVIVKAVIVGAGGGGSGGTVTFSTGANGGSSGGGGGERIDVRLFASELNETEPVVVGAGGTSGAGVTATATGSAAALQGGKGGDGGLSSFATSYVAAGGLGGSASSNVNNAVSAGGTGGNNLPISPNGAFFPTYYQSNDGGTGAASDNNPAFIAVVNTIAPVSAGGAHGEYGSVATTSRVGFIGGSAGTGTGSTVTGGAAGLAGNNPGGNGSTSADGFYASGGGSGGGTYVASGIATGGRGGNGGSPGGGGGAGGYARNNTATAGIATAISGSGGTGGNGLVIVYTYG